MTALTCVLGRIGGVAPPRMPLAVGSLPIDQIFAVASGEDITLTIDDSRLGDDADPARRNVNSYDLHDALRTITRNRPDRPVSRIGVIYAGEYSRFPQVLGIMFDRGFSTVDDQNSGFQAVPREGCAVFTDSIRRFRAGDPEATAAEIAFTTVHELGHVFNLEHTAEPSFLSLSSTGGVHGPDYHRFAEAHAGYLQNCSRLRCIHPGGTAYGDRGEVGASFDPNSNNSPAETGSSPVHLEIRLTRLSFWFFEPVELELTVSVPKSAGRRTIPDTLDPGYDQFAIWIVSPNGERRAYRSPKFFCAQSRRRVISATKPFQRDLSVFGEAGGYTFRQPGQYRMWATWRIGKSTTIASNTVALEIRAPLARYREVARMMRPCILAGSLFYYRAARKLRHAEEVIAQVRASAPRSANAAIAGYALGRAYAHRAVGGKNAAVGHARTAARLLEEALESQKLGSHSDRRARSCLEAMQRISEE